MNVYDFDGTIYDGDSSVDFWRFCAWKRPDILLRLPGFAVFVVGNKVGKVSKTRLKEEFFSFLRVMPATDALLKEFWDCHWAKVKPFYFRLKADDDVVASASPEFLLAPACDRLGVRRLVASCVDPATGRFTRENCRGEEKAARLQEAFPNSVIDDFYSDSGADEPLARLAKRAWRVSGGRIEPWRFE